MYALKRHAGSPHRRRRAVTLAESFAIGCMRSNAARARRIGDGAVAPAESFTLGGSSVPPINPVTQLR
jgi:hypothetical protein